MKSEIMSEYHCDDYRLVVLIHGEDDQPTEHGWLFYFLATLAVGVPVLGVLAWCYR